MDRINRKYIFTGIIIIALIVFFSVIAGYHFMQSADAENIDALTKQASEYFGVEKLEILETTQKGDYLATLCVDNENVSYLCVYDRDKIFSNRWYASGGVPEIENGKVVSLNYGSPDGEALLVFGGANLSDEVRWYTFQNGDVIYTCPVENNLVLDMFVLIDENNINGTPTLLDEEKTVIAE